MGGFFGISKVSRRQQSLSSGVLVSQRALVVAALALLVSIAVSAGVLEGLVVAVTDGDRIKVLDSSNSQHTIRLAGIDAPERKMAYGQRAKQSLSDLVYGKYVTVQGEKTDRYGRRVGKVLVDGRDANLSQIEMGLAWHYKQYQREQSQGDVQKYAKAEVEAKVNGRGLWAHQNPIPPWDYRKELRRE